MAQQTDTGATMIVLEIERRGKKAKNVPQACMCQMRDKNKDILVQYREEARLEIPIMKGLENNTS